MSLAGAVDAAGQRRRDILGALLFVVAWLFFTVEMMGVRILAADLAVPQLAFVRTATQAVLMAALALVLGRKMVATRRIGMHGARAFSSTFGMVLFYFAFALLPVAIATTLTFMQASFVTLFAVVFLGEVIGWRRIGAVALGFVGVLVVMRPGLDGFDPAMLLALGGAAVSAALLVITRSLSLTDGRFTIMFYSSVLGLALIALPAALMWQPVSGDHLLLLVLISLSGVVGQFLMVGAFRLAEASVLAPVDYVRLVFAVIAGYLLFSEIPDVWTVVGSVIILLSAATIAARRPETAPSNEPMGTPR